MLIAIISAYMARKGLLRKPWGVLACILSLAAVGGFLGSLITWCINGAVKEGFGVDKEIFSAAHWGEFINSILADLFRDLLDKTVTVLLVLIPYFLIPKNIRRKLRFRGWQQRALSHEEKDEHQSRLC